MGCSKTTLKTPLHELHKVLPEATIQWFLPRSGIGVGFMVLAAPGFSPCSRFLSPSERNLQHFLFKRTQTIATGADRLPNFLPLAPLPRSFHRVKEILISFTRGKEIPISSDIQISERSVAKYVKAIASYAGLCSNAGTPNHKQSGQSQILRPTLIKTIDIWP